MKAAYPLPQHFLFIHTQSVGAIVHSSKHQLDKIEDNEEPCSNLWNNEEEQDASKGISGSDIKNGAHRLARNGAKSKISPGKLTVRMEILDSKQFRWLLQTVASCGKQQNVPSVMLR